MFASFGAMLVGLGWWLIAGEPGGTVSAAKVIPLDKLGAELAALNPLALVNQGVVLLLATPGVTLIAQVAAYLAARNPRWAGVAGLVALILLLSLALS